MGEVLDTQKATGKEVPKTHRVPCLRAMVLLLFLVLAVSFVIPNVSSTATLLGFTELTAYSNMAEMQGEHEEQNPHLEQPGEEGKKKGGGNASIPLEETGAKGNEKEETQSEMHVPQTNLSRPSRFLIAPYPKFPRNGPVRWTALPKIVQQDFKMGGRISTKLWFKRQVGKKASPRWSKKMINRMVGKVKKGNPNVKGLAIYGARTNRAFFQAIKRFPVANKTVLVIGSRFPWVEAFCLANQAKQVTTIDFNVPRGSYPNLRLWSLADLDASDEKFDVVISYSSLEHDGLGRYGDPIHPFGDLERMKKIKGLVVEKSGLLFLGVPIGKDTLVYNAHRIYGPKRYPKLVKGWKVLGSFGWDLRKQLWIESLKIGMIQPVVVLTLSKRKSK